MSERVKIIALRGASHEAPENTVAAIKEAVKAGVDVVALDVQGSKDDEPVLIGDARVDRVTNGQGRVAHLTLKELQQLDAGSWFDPKFAGTKLATLEEGLKALGKKTRAMLLLPQMDAGGKLAANVLAALKTRGASDDLLVFTDSGTLKGLREKAPGAGCVLALDEKVDGWIHLEKARSLGLKTIRPHARQVNAKLVRDARARELTVYVHFADEADDLRELVELKVDGIVTGRPERLKEILDGAKS
ncbi:MAG: glycerophosphodiester phosphodiesterase family protein [Planctomycetota bacterium]|nr:glycerophosphodiester phosphodiesterase family protein [Planctomycetota bacterium]